MDNRFRRWASLADRALLIAGVMISAACGTTATQQSAAAAQEIRPQDLYAELMAQPEDVRIAAATRLGQMPISEFYVYLKALATNAPVIIDGVKQPGGLQSLQADEASFTWLSTHFHTVNALWTALNIAPNRLSYSSFKADLDLAMDAPSPALELANYSYVQSDDASRQSCDRMKGRLSIDSNVATGIESYVANALTSASNTGESPAGIRGTNASVYFAGERRLPGGLYQARGTIRASLGTISRYGANLNPARTTLSQSALWIQSCFIGVDPDTEPSSVDSSTLTPQGTADFMGTCAADQDPAWAAFMNGLYRTLAAAQAALGVSKCSNGG